MVSIAILGMQWGDEGKGKVVDLLSEKAKHIARAQGGNNAGHTILVGSPEPREFRFNLIPSGILYPDSKCYIGGGTVLDPPGLLKEMEGLRTHQVSFEKRLFISSYAHVVMPYHKLLDKLCEERMGSSAIGTTGKGIGPCYVDKVRRTGIRMAELIDPQLFRARLETVLPLKNEEFEKIYGVPGLDGERLYAEYGEYGKKLKPYVAPVEEMLFEAHVKKESILFEGAQGALLDVTFGTYPFVTSSCTLAGGVSAGLGFGPTRIGHVLGVAKAYTTRVGNGPFPTELGSHELALFPDHVASREIGTTTGRKRRIGWLDIPILRTTCRWNGADSLALMKLDILDGLEEVKICVGYLLNGKKMEFFPTTVETLSEVEPIYEMHPGWRRSTKGCQIYDDLPHQAKKYIRRIEHLLNVPISLISVGPEREKTVWLDQLL
jgi:adenylosuccinate synthase